VGVGCLGRIVPGQRILRLTFPSETIVKTIRVQRQEWVKADSILALAMDYELKLADLERARQEVGVSRSQVLQLEAGEKEGALDALKATITKDLAEVANREKARERAEALFRQGVLSQSDLDQTNFQAVSAEQNLNSDQNRLASLRDIRPVDLAAARYRFLVSEASLRVAQAQVELSVLRAPFDGKVLGINTYPGETTSSLGVVEFADTSALQVEAELHVEDVARVHLGSVARLRCEGIPEELEGTVTELSPTVRGNSIFDTNPLESNDVRVISAWIRLRDPLRLSNRINAQVIVRILP
jgi:HlyD family secretion protein